MSPRIVALTAALTLAASGCGVLPSNQAAPPSADQPSGPPTSAPATTSAASEEPTATPTTTGQDTREALAETRGTEDANLKVEVVGLNRVKGKHLVVQIRLSNTGAEKDLPWAADMGDPTRELGKMDWASGIGVLDAQAHTWLLPYKPADLPCLCSDQDRDDLPYFIKPGQSITVYGVLPAPSGNPTTTTVVTPVAPPMPNLPISDDPPAGDFPDPDAEPVIPVTRSVLLPSESLDKSEETADDGKDLQVSLSSDVLFAVDKATLTPRAKAVLARTARLIDASPATSVKVEGHADSSGNDAINDPLSLRRAQAVQRALSGLLTRDRVGFQAKGYGSRRPLYGNDTEEGKRRNRRVTVTFAKPEAAASPDPAGNVVQTLAPGADELTATVKAQGQPFALEITGLRRLAGGMGVLTYTIANKGSAEAWFHELNRDDRNSYKYISATNVRLTDVAARRQYVPARLPVTTDNGVDAYCACTGVSGVRLSSLQFAPGQTREFWGLFALPDGAQSLKVKIATFGDLQVPVQ